MAGYKRILGFACSHGIHIDPQARSAILNFRDAYKPHTVVHLGDAIDTAAFRSGARGTSDEAEPVEPDIDEGLGFIRDAGVTHYLAGNHEDRLWNLAEHPNAIVSYAAAQCIHAIKDLCKERKITFVKWDGIFQGLKFGNFTFLHGALYSENATRDHAEAIGNCVHAHNHRPAISCGRRLDCPIGFGVGTLTRRREMGYAKSRRATTAWGQAFVWGEYNDRVAHLNLCLGPQEQQPNSEWRLP